MRVMFATLLLLAICGSALCDGVEWFPGYHTYNALAPDAVGTESVVSVSSITLELGAGVGILSGAEFALSLSVGVLDFPDTWGVVGGERLFVFAGTVGGTKCAGPALSVSQLGDGWRIGVPLWTEGGEPHADIAVWKSTSFDLAF